DNQLPSHAFQIRRRCGNHHCSNPKHLYEALSNGREVSDEELDEWDKSDQPSNAIAGSQNPWERPITKLTADLPNLSAISADIDVLQPKHETEYFAAPAPAPAPAPADGASDPTAPASSSTVRRSYAAWISLNCP